MFKILPVAIATVLASVSPTVQAEGSFDKPDAEFLIGTCHAVTQIYNDHAEKRFLASQRTSLSDAMRAGYCLGIMEQYECTGWGKYALFESARRIAALDGESSTNKYASIDRILKQSVCR